MYLRHTTRRKDGKVHRYWRLVRSVRVGGKVVQQTVAQLGEMGQALRFLLRAQEGEPDNAEVRLKLASIYLMGRPDEAKHTLTELTLKASDFLPA